MIVPVNINTNTNSVENSCVAFSLNCTGVGPYAYGDYFTASANIASKYPNYRNITIGKIQIAILAAPGYQQSPAADQGQRTYSAAITTYVPESGQMQIGIHTPDNHLLTSPPAILVVIRE